MTPDEFDLILKYAVPDVETRAKIAQHAREEFRRGYLVGKREMKMHIENAVANLRVEES